MDDPNSLLLGIGKYGVLPALVLYFLQLAVSKFWATRTDATEQSARTDLIEGLSTRISALETAQVAAIAALEDERTKRRAAEDSVFALTRRVMSLESQLRAAGFDPAKL